MPLDPIEQRLTDIEARVDRLDINLSSDLRNAFTFAQDQFWPKQQSIIPGRSPQPPILDGWTPYAGSAALTFKIVASRLVYKGVPVTVRNADDTADFAFDTDIVIPGTLGRDIRCYLDINLNPNPSPGDTIAKFIMRTADEQTFAQNWTDTFKPDDPSSHEFWGVADILLTSDRTAILWMRSPRELHIPGNE